MARLRRGLGNRAPNAADAAAVAQRKARRDKAFQLRVEGFSAEQIARELGVTPKTVRLDLRKVLSTPPEGAEQARKLAVSRREKEVVRLAALAARLRPLANPEDSERPPDMDAVQALARISRTIAIHQKAIEEMTVPELPKRVEHTGANGGPIEHVTLEDVSSAIEAAAHNDLGGTRHPEPGPTTH